MNKQRLLKLAAHLETAKIKGFDFSVTNEIKGGHDVDYYGDRGCAIRELVRVFPRLCKTVPKEMPQVATFFGITYTEAELLFRYNFLGENPKTPKQVAKLIRAFVK